MNRKETQEGNMTKKHNGNGREGKEITSNQTRSETRRKENNSKEETDKNPQ